MFLIDCRWLSLLISPISSFPCFPMPTFPICSMYGIFTNICPKNHPNVVKYTIHGAYGVWDGYLILKLNYNPISSHFWGNTKRQGHAGPHDLSWVPSERPWGQVAQDDHRSFLGGGDTSPMMVVIPMWRFSRMEIPLVIIHFDRMSPYKATSCWGTPIFWKTPCVVVAFDVCPTLKSKHFFPSETDLALSYFLG